MPYASQTYLEALLLQLIKTSRESEWLEFKSNVHNELRIGEYISALSNSAAIENKDRGYLVWGIQDQTLEIIGTEYDPFNYKIGNEDLDHWLSHMLSPTLSFRFHKFTYQNKNIVILEVPRANGQPTRFQKRSYIRCGAHNHPLSEYPNLERDLWDALRNTKFEQEIAIPNINQEAVLRLLDYPSYFYSMNRNLPDNAEGILDGLCQDNLIQKSAAGKWNITNLGALLFARDLQNFNGLKRKMPRVILYEGNSKLSTIREEEFCKGYGISFDEIISKTQILIPSTEIISSTGIRSVHMEYPELAVREIIANALIHQDFHVSGTGVTIEIFSNRIVITNPGRSLVNIDRMIDTPPRSRNEDLASFLRRVGVCEERGSGFDKIVSELESHHLPPPEITEYDEHFVVTLSTRRSYSDLTRQERLNGCYLHACLQFVNQSALTNTSLRERFEIETKNSSLVSRLIKEAVQEKLIKAVDPDTAPRYMRYIPFWG